MVTALSFTCECWHRLLLYKDFLISPSYPPSEWKLCSRHLVTTSLVIVLRTLTNNYFLLFSPFTMYRWKNPQYKFLLLLDRQWPMYAQCRRCLFRFCFENNFLRFFFLFLELKSKKYICMRLIWRNGSSPLDEVTFCAAICVWIPSVNSQISLWQHPL